MIVKDEADWIRQCLESVHSVVYEAIVVDTGSCDATVDIAQSYGARVLRFSWCDDFAAARNFSLSQASGDWVLVLDADEMIAPKDLQGLRNLTATSSVCYEFAQRHYTDDHRLSNFTPVCGEFPEIERGQLGYFESRCVRLFPNHRGLHFQGKVHELVEHSIKLNPEITVARTDIRIHHFGHTAAVRGKKNKSPLYHALGRDKTTAAPQDWKNFYELGVECNCSGRLHEAAQALVRSIELNPNYLPSWTNLGYVFCELGEFEAALDALLHAIKLAPRSAEAYCNLGVVYMRMGIFPAAERVFAHALVLNPQYVNVICNLAETLIQLGRLSEAAFQYQRALALAPGCPSATADLGALYLHAGVFDEAERLIRQAVAMPLVQERARHNLHTLLTITARTNEAASLLEAISTPQPPQSPAAPQGESSEASIAASNESATSPQV